MKTVATYKGIEIKENSAGQIVCEDLGVLRSFCQSQLGKKVPDIDKSRAAKIAGALRSGTYDAKADVEPEALLPVPEPVPAPTVPEVPSTPPGAEPKPAKKSYGQCGPALQLTYATLTAKEQKMFDALAAGEMDLKSLAQKTFVISDGLKFEQSRSWVRNSLRRLVRSSMVRRVRESVYVRAAS
jgi:hypothetical protein